MLLLNDIVVEAGKFPNKETYVKIDNSGLLALHEKISVEIKFENNDDLINLLCLKDTLDRYAPQAHKILYIAYMPYSRMDRLMVDYAFSLKAVAKMINNLNFDEVHVLEPHSDVTTALLDRAFGHFGTPDVAKQAMKKISFNKNKDYILFPDAGAQKRYADNFKGYKTIVASKKRDLESGKIIEFQVHTEAESLDGCKILIVDDLCSRGGTFLGIAEILKDMHASEIYLAVTHLENHVLTGGLPHTDIVQGVFATSSIFTRGKDAFDKLTIVEV